MICPKRGDLVSKLYKSGSAGISASRKAHRLACHPQRQSSHDRALSQAFKRQRLGSTGGIGDDIEKPKRMRLATFDREMNRLQQAESIVTGHTWALLKRLDQRSEQ